MSAALALPADYADWLASLKKRIQGARQRALLSANEEQIRLYHEIGRGCLERPECPDFRIGQQSAAQLPWFHIIAKIKAPDDHSTIGLLLCRSQNRLVAEHALSGIKKPIGVAEYQLLRALPTPLDTVLPTIEEIEAELSRALDQEANP